MRGRIFILPSGSADPKTGGAHRDEFGCSRNAVFEAIRADEIAATTGCGSDQAEWVKYLTDLNSTPEARRIYRDEELKGLAERTQIPNNDYLCAIAIWVLPESVPRPPLEYGRDGRLAAPHPEERQGDHQGA